MQSHGNGEGQGRGGGDEYSSNLASITQGFGAASLYRTSYPAPGAYGASSGYYEQPAVPWLPPQQPIHGNPPPLFTDRHPTTGLYEWPNHNDYDTTAQTQTDESYQLPHHDSDTSFYPERGGSTRPRGDEWDRATAQSGPELRLPPLLTIGELEGTRREKWEQAKELYAEALAAVGNPKQREMSEEVRAMLHPYWRLRESTAANKGREERSEAEKEAAKQHSRDYHASNKEKINQYRRESSQRKKEERSAAKPPPERTDYEKLPPRYTRHEISLMGTDEACDKTTRIYDEAKVFFGAPMGAPRLDLYRGLREYSEDADYARDRRYRRREADEARREAQKGSKRQRRH